MKIDRVTVRRLELPLTVPYKLSLGVIEAFHTVVIEMRDVDGKVGYGEATVLHGYTHETVDQTWTQACLTAQGLPGLEKENARRRIVSMCGQDAFTATALNTSLEMLEDNELLKMPAGASVSLLAVVHTEEGSALEAELEDLLQAGYKTLKIKVGFDVEADLARVARIQHIVSGRARIRLDANQGYDREQACRFIGELNPMGIELVEQTCAAGDWEAAVAVARYANIPMMLDESIYSIRDVERAAELECARYIKFKLMKAGGLSALAKALQRIRELGMEPVLGNGVAAELSCWMEACVAYRYITNAGEMNGFLKPRNTVFLDPLRVEAGQLYLPQSAPRLAPEMLDQVTVKREEYGRAVSYVTAGPAEDS